MLPPVGSDPTAAGGGGREGSEWQRSKFRERTANRKFRVPQQGDSLDLGECLTPVSPVQNIEKYADVVELVDSLDLGAVTSVKVF